MSQSPGGLQSSGDSDIRNFYDRISAGQNLELRPALAPLDEVLVRSALGTRPPDVHYVWAPLWQTSDSEKAEIFAKKAKGVKDLVDAAVIPAPVLGKGVLNMLIEDQTMPGLDAAAAEFGDEPPEGSEDDEAARLQAEADRLAAQQ